jgi:SAM-dependent methyltransferase
MNSPISCPACGHNTFRPLESIDVTAQHRLYAPFDEVMQQRLNEQTSEVTNEYCMTLCSGCGLEFAWPLRAPRSGWYDLAYEALDLYPSQRWEFAAAFEQFRSDDFVFEFGCGSGAFLKKCHERSIKAIGVDFSSNAVRRCQEDGLDARRMDVAQLPLNASDPRPTHILAFHLLEHLEDPAELFRQAANLATPTTQLWIAVPSDRRSTRKFG